MPELTPEQIKKQELYRDARFTDQYDEIWQTVGKCVFCELNEKYVFFEENGVVMTISLYAYIDGHFMIVPRRHIRSTKDLTEFEWTTIRKFTYLAKKLVRDVHGIKGMQLVQKDGSVAQSTVTDHIHFHVVPFDSADLLTWNYRKLKNTPLENVELYKRAGKKMLSIDKKFDAKYANKTSLPIICDAIITNDKQQILFQEREPGSKLVPDYITLPGGRVDDYSQTLESELAREIKEEINYEVDTADLKLVSSRIDEVNRPHRMSQIEANYTSIDRFMRNTYHLSSMGPETILEAGDDAQALIWVAIDDIATHDRVSESTKEIIARVFSK